MVLFFSGEVEKWRSGEVEKWRSGEVEKWRSGEVEKSVIIQDYLAKEILKVKISTYFQ